jgi:lipid-A-disaccharide synthase-like uncharacterized protein
LRDPALFALLGVESWGETAWVGVGLAGQALFFTRFAMQWIASERARRSVVPPAFWALSLAGSVLVLAYALWRRDPVFVIGQSLGVFVYARNLWLIRAEARRER